MPPQRLIDRDTRIREKPMRVLVLGMCRTGTSSIAAALTRLGYNPHHMTSILARPNQAPLWHEAVNVTFLPDSERPPHQRGALPYGRPEFDKLLAEYDAVTDLPSALFVDQLVAAYPDAKVVLTNREYESWKRSMDASIYGMLQWKIPGVARVFGLTSFAPLLRMIHALFRVHCNNNYNDPEARAAFDAQYAHVRRVVPKERLLEFGPKFSWEPLCEFLGDEVPDEPYPFVNDAKEMRQRLDGMWRAMAMNLVAVTIVPVGIVGGLYYWGDGIWNFLSSAIGQDF